MVTATTVALNASFDVAPQLRFVTVHKSSSDPAFSVAGAEFAIVGSHGVVATATTDASGVAAFAPIDPVATPGPYVVRELTAPPGLLTAADVPVPAASVDPAHPTVVPIVDAPARAPVQLRKILSEPVDAPDLAGFTFVVRRTDGGFEDEFVTGAEGLTDPIALTLGNYEACEASTPEWAANLVDGGCIHFAVGLDDLSRTDPRVFEYLNIVATTTLPPTTSSPDVAQPSSTTTTVATTTTTITTTSTTPTTTSVVAALPPAPSTSAPLTAPRPLPRTGGGAARLLDFADIGFIVGVALVTIIGLLPRRPERETAGR
jgi:hypothetical protein